MPNVSDVLQLVSEFVGAPVSWIFGVILAVHVAGGLTAVVTGAVGLLRAQATLAGLVERAYGRHEPVVHCPVDGLLRGQWAEAAAVRPFADPGVLDRPVGDWRPALDSRTAPPRRICCRFARELSCSRAVSRVAKRRSRSRPGRAARSPSRSPRRPG